ncbi:MBL fold metallo-hydrolase [Microbispora hainanensis]|uniref:MBL fold metallo-hydrolase n=1 Tax=Microbispora hainanensis TaxID=568844 RepID=A0A544YY93_9ACTN|nr:MBL fold metallo-hydrolase [Microbispora hainanensis]TQS21734.1 MBL fold metallo-hydrolase [Microbispora hainanensis]
MKIHHLNCGSMRKLEPIDDGLPSAHAVAHCLLVETDRDGLVLVEAGLGLGNVRDPAGSLAADWTEMVEPVLDPAETAVRQVERLGYAPADVRHILLTHLDVDHSGGLPDFPDARVHVLEEELTAALAEAPSRRYRPAHWAHGPRWETYGTGAGEEWFGFGGVRRPHGLPADFLLVPLGGHTAGHAAVAVRDGGRWLLHAGDAYFYHGELRADEPQPHPLLDLVQTGSQVDAELRLRNRDRLRGLVRDHADEVEVFSAHDPWELRRYTSPGE